MTLIFVVLVAASLLSSIALPIAGRQVRLEHLAAPIASAALLGLYRFSSDTIRINAYVVLATAWVLVNALSSWLFAVDPSESFVHVLRLGLLALTFLTVANLRPFNAPAWGARVRIWLVLGCVELAYGAFTWGAARFAGLWLPGAWIDATASAVRKGGSPVSIR